MFNDWKQEKAKAALVDEAQAMADRLAAGKPHLRDGYAAAAWFWAASHRAAGKELLALSDWKPADLARFVSATQTKIAALRKARDYEQSDGLAVWLHTARAVTEPRIAPPVREIWQLLLSTGQNADAMAADLAAEAGLPAPDFRSAPKGFDPLPDAD